MKKLITLAIALMAIPFTGKDLEYIKDMISGISLQIAGVAISN
jgi:hypothetical protein